MKIRKGKNIFFRLAVTMADGEPENFTNAYGLRISITERFSGTVYLPSVRIEENVLFFEFPGTENRNAGDYNLSLTYKKVNYGSTIGYEPFFLDIPSAFQTVDLTSQEDITPVANNLESVSVTIKGDVNAPRNGIDGTTPHIGENGNWFLRDEDTGVPARGPAFTYADFTAEEIEGLQRPAVEAAQSAKDAVAMLNGIVTEQNRKIASLEGLVMSLFNPLALKHYDRVVADGGTIFASYKELSDWFDTEGITQEDMDGTGEFQLIRIDPYYTGVRIDPSSTSNLTYVNKVYNINKRFDMVMYTVNKPMELTKDYCLRKDMYDKGRGIKTIPFGFYFKNLSCKVTAIPEQFSMEQVYGDYANMCPIIGMFHASIGTAFNYMSNSTHDAVIDFSPKIGIRSYIDGTGTYRRNIYLNIPSSPGSITPYKMEFNSLDVGLNILINEEQVDITSTGEDDQALLNQAVMDDVGLVSIGDKGYMEGTQLCGSVRFRDFKFRFKEYTDSNGIMLLPLDGPVNEPFTEEEIKYLEEQQLNSDL